MAENLDFLGPSYSDLLDKIDIQDDMTQLLEQLIECEPRACIDLYSSFDATELCPQNPKSQQTLRAKKSAETTDIEMELSPDIKPDKKEGKARSSKYDDDEPIPADDSDDAELANADTQLLDDMDEMPTVQDPIEPPYTLPNGLDTYFALYIWSLLHARKWMDAAGLVKRYKETILFTSTDNEIIHASAKAAYLFTKAYPAALSHFAYPSTSMPADTTDLQASVDKAKQNSLVTDYPAIYALGSETAWDDTSKHGHPLLKKIVTDTLADFQKKTYCQLVTSFTAIRLSTLQHYLSLPADWTAAETVLFFQKTFKETGRWEIKTAQSKSVKDLDASNIVLVPPVNSSVPSKSDEEKTERSTTSLQFLINTATHLEQHIPGFTST